MAEQPDRRKLGLQNEMAISAFNYLCSGCFMTEDINFFLLSHFILEFLLNRNVIILVNEQLLTLEHPFFKVSMLLL